MDLHLFEVEVLVGVVFVDALNAGVGLNDHEGRGEGLAEGSDFTEDALKALVGHRTRGIDEHHELDLCGPARAGKVEAAADVLFRRRPRAPVVADAVVHPLREKRSPVDAGELGALQKTLEAAALDARRPERLEGFETGRLDGLFDLLLVGHLDAPRQTACKAVVLMPPK